MLLDFSDAKNAMVAQKRLGRIKYSVEVIATAQTEMLKAIFSKLVPVKLEFDFPDQAFDMVAYSSAFEPVGEVEQIPEYQVQITPVKRKTGIAYYVKFVKQEHSALADLLGLT